MTDPIDISLAFLEHAAIVAGAALLAVIVALCVVIHKGDP